MRERQERQEQIVLVDLQALQRCVCVLQHVVVRQHHAFRAPGRARRIDDARELLAVAVDVFHRAGSFGQPIIQAFQSRIRRCAGHGIQADNSFDPGKLFLHFGELPPLLRILEEQQLGTRVLDDVGDIFGTIRGIQRHRDQIEPHRSLIKHHPGDAVSQRDRHPVSGL